MGEILLMSITATVCLLFFLKGEVYKKKAAAYVVENSLIEGSLGI